MKVSQFNIKNLFTKFTYFLFPKKKASSNFIDDSSFEFPQNYKPTVTNGELPY